MAKRPAKPPKVILNPDLADDDDDTPTLAVPDDDGWVYLQRKQGEDAKQKRDTKATRRKPR